MQSRISSLYFSWFFGRGGGRVDINSYHHCWIWGLFPAILIHLINNFSMEGNSVAASSSSAKMAVSITLISSRDVSIKVRKVSVSSVLQLSLHCSGSSVVLEIIRYMASLTLRSPRGNPYVFHVSKRVACPYYFFYFVQVELHPFFRLASQEGALVTYLVPFYNKLVCKF